MLALAEEPKLARPKFTNAAKIMAMCDDKEHLRYVCVKDQTANITNGKVLIRRFVGATAEKPNIGPIPDGLYDVDVHGNLSPAPLNFEEAMKYPNLELIISPISQKGALTTFCSVPKEAIAAMIPLCHKAVAMEGSVIIGGDGAYIRQNPAEGMVNYPFNVVPPLNFNPKFLEVALIEMLQYPSVYLLRQLSNQNAPLIFGVDLGSCALICPFSVDYDE